MKISRRDALGLVVAGAGVAALGKNVEAGQAKQSAASTPAPAFRGEHKPAPLPFDPAKLNGLSEKLIRSHWENNYGGSVKALNAVERRLGAMLSEPDLPTYVYGDLKREELLRTGSVVLHELYFANLGGDGRAGGRVLDALKRSWGSAEAWEAEFRKTAEALGGGSGWAVLAHNLHTGELHNYWAWDHMHGAAMGRPLLVIDMYEHSYHMDYGAAAARYVDAFMKNVNWAEVERRHESALKTQSA